MATVEGAVRVEGAGRAEGAVRVDIDDAVAEFQGHLNLIFARARSLWKESAARVHPDLQPSGYKLLTFIARVGDANAHQISDRFEIDKSAISRQVRMLEDFGLIESRPDESDGRLRVLTATAAARQAWSPSAATTPTGFAWHSVASARKSFGRHRKCSVISPRSERAEPGPGPGRRGAPTGFAVNWRA